jgi:hypothetical protein
MQKIINFLCRIGIHTSTFSDSSYWTRGVRVCNHCGGAAGDKQAFAELQEERALWNQVPKEIDTADKMVWVAHRMSWYTAAMPG